MKWWLLVVLALSSAGWAVSETRPRRRILFVPRVRLAPPEPAPAEPPSPSRPLPAPIRAAPPRPPKPVVARISGRVVYDDGEPAEDASVVLSRRNERLLVPAEEDGSFSTEVPPGAYRIYAMNHVADSTETRVIVESAGQVDGLELALRRPEDDQANDDSASDDSSSDESEETDE